jgi:hypothetical protein
VNDYGSLLDRVAARADDTPLADPATVRAVGERRARRNRSILVGAAAAAMVTAVAAGVVVNHTTSPGPSHRPSHPPSRAESVPWPSFQRPSPAPTPPEGVQPQRVRPAGSRALASEVNGVAVSNGRYLVVGERYVHGGNRSVPVGWVSPDGVHWTGIAPWPERYGVAGPVVGTDSGFVMVVTGKGSRGGYLVPPYVLRSTDGVSWSTSSLPVPARYLGDLHPLYFLQTTHALVLVTGHGAAPGQVIWVSRDDGVSWSPQAANYFDPTPGGDEVCAAREVGGQLVLAVGHPHFVSSRTGSLTDAYDDTQWRSTDGSHWTRISTVKGRQNRSEHFCAISAWQRARSVSGPDGILRVTPNNGAIFWPTASR